MKIRFQWLGNKKHIPRPTKQKEKEKIKKTFQLPNIKSFYCYEITNSCKVYSTLLQREFPIAIFEKKLLPKNNYFFGKFKIKKEEIYFLINIGDLISISGEYHIFPENKLTAFLYKSS